jgi:acetyltransferase-like isoleucine patch superfamily enzyme
MSKMVLRNIVARWLKSNNKVHDLYSLVISSFKHPTIFISHRIRSNISGQIVSNKLVFIGVFTNQLGLDYPLGGQFVVYDGGLASFGYHVRVSNGCKIFVKGTLSIGEQTYINPNSMIYASSQITIGKRCAISWNFQAIDCDMHFVIRNGEKVPNVAPITIGDHVWIGANVSVLKGVTIGDNSIVAAGSVVTKSFPNGSLIGGNPARLISENINWE